MSETGAMAWWKTGTIYQIYPRSFQDSDGDGVGDLDGIRRRLAHVAGLGVDAIWLSPIFRSPMKDFGYDIADYCAIDPLFGTMETFDRLLAETHAAGLKLILDFVPNHTSDQHDWFLASRSSRRDPKRDWYLWRDAAPGGGPPNNWMSNFGGSAWQWDEATEQYYYHAFLKEQPDLNWRNPAVRAAMFDTLRFWLDKGVDGFRVDVIWLMIKDAEFRDNPDNPGWRPGQPDIDRHLQVHSADQPEVHQVIEEMRAVIDGYPGRLLIGEIYLPIRKLVSYYGKDNRGVDLPFNFQLLRAKWDAATIAGLVDEYEAALPEGGWPNWVLGNHDQPRIAARVGEAQARVAAMLLLTLRGTPTLYYGDELAIGDVTIPFDRIQDPQAKNEPDTNFDRDKARTPMQWSVGEHAGFSDADPWLPLTVDHGTRTVEAMAHDPGSMLALTKALLALRRTEPTLQTGAYRRLAAGNGLFAFERIGPGGRIGIFLNLSAVPVEFDVPSPHVDAAVVLAAQAPQDHDRLPGRLRLAGDQGFVVKAKTVTT